VYWRGFEDPRPSALPGFRGFGFDCARWSRSPHSTEAAHSFSGPTELGLFLARTYILVCLLPLTPETRGFLNAALFSSLPKGAGLVPVGRGKQLVDADLLDAIASGQSGDAILDVTEPEPLPPSHPFWHHPNSAVTPHIAGMTQPETAAEVVIATLRRYELGEAMIGLVDRAKGY